MIVATDVEVPEVMMSEREKESLILMLRRIDEMCECKDTPDTGAGATCAWKKKNTMTALLAVQPAANSLLDLSTDVCLSSHKSMKSMLTEGDSTNTTSQHETIDSDIMDLVALDSHGMDLVALDVEVVGGRPSAEPEATRIHTTSKMLPRQNAGVFGLSRTETEAQHGQGLCICAMAELTTNQPWSRRKRGHEECHNYMHISSTFSACTHAHSHLGRCTYFSSVQKPVISLTFTVDRQPRTRERIKSSCEVGQKSGKYGKRVCNTVMIYVVNVYWRRTNMICKNPFYTHPTD